MSEATQAAKPAKVKKKSSGLSFPQIYFGTLLLFVILDYFNIMHPTKHFYETFPRNATWAPLQLGESPVMAFLAKGSVVLVLLHLWRSVVKAIASKVALPFAGLTDDPSASQEVRDNHEKFCEQAWLFVHYAIATSLEYMFLADKQWWPPNLSQRQREMLNVPYEIASEDQMDTGLYLFYLMQFSFYGLELVTLVATWKRRREDGKTIRQHCKHSPATVV